MPVFSLGANLHINARLIFQDKDMHDNNIGVYRRAIHIGSVLAAEAQLNFYQPSKIEL